jgi:hypothetical protein
MKAIARKDIERLENTSPSVFGLGLFPSAAADPCQGISLCETASVCDATVCQGGSTVVVCIGPGLTTCVEETTACAGGGTACAGEATVCASGDTACEAGSTV